MGRRRKGRSLSPPLLGSDGQYVAGGGLPTPKRQRHRRPEVASGESSAAPASEKKKGNLRHYAVLYGTSREKRRDLRQEVKQHAVLHQAVSGDAASASSAREENLTQEEEAKAQSSLTSTNVTNTAHENSDQPDTLAHAISSGEIEGLHWRDAQLEEETQRLEKHITFSILPAVDIGRDDFWSLYEGQALKRLNERLALYRIKARKISEGALLEELVDAKLIEEYPPAILEDNGYFQGYERHFEWHFDTDYKYFECVGLQDYQRLALNKDFDYLDWDEYQTYNTYQGDQEFVEFYEKLSSKAKWMGFPEVDWQYERRRYQRLAIYQAVKIAAGYNNISLSLLYTGFSDFLWSINHDTSIYKEIANFYFEMWKRIAKEKMSFVDALQQVYDQGICARCPFNMKLELAGDPGSSIMKINYDTYVAVISGEVQENEARLMIAEAAKKIVHKRKIYYDYARKKLDIARKIGVIPLQDDDEEVQDGEGSWHWN